MEDEETATSRFGRIKIPPILGRLVPIGANNYLPIEELIRNNLDLVFAGHRITNSTLFRVTRNADFEVSEGAADDLLAAAGDAIALRNLAGRPEAELAQHRARCRMAGVEDLIGVIYGNLAELQVAGCRYFTAYNRLF